MKRKPRPALTDPRQPWQITQGARCACRGTDDYCACQNAEEPWKYGLGGSPPPTREQELESQVRRLEGHIETLTKQQETDRQTIASLLAARALLDAAPPCEGWRPIASAPKDGTMLDLWVFFPEHQQARRVADAFWDAEEGSWRFGRIGVLAKQLLYPPEARFWMPLPAPPASNGEAAGRAALQEGKGDA